MIRHDTNWYDMIRYDIIWYDMIWYDMIYDMIWYDIWYYMIWYLRSSHRWVDDGLLECDIVKIGTHCIYQVLRGIYCFHLKCKIWGKLVLQKYWCSSSILVSCIPHVLEDYNLEFEVPRCTEYGYSTCMPGVHVLKCEKGLRYIESIQRPEPGSVTVQWIPIDFTVTRPNFFSLPGVILR